MSHFAVLVLVPPGTEDHEEEVTRLLEPYSEDGYGFRDADDERPESKWDWWVIGGRYTGRLTGRDPETDPENWEPCDICAGTGTRPDGLERFGAEWVAQMNGCNGCLGKGTRVAWTLKPYDGDVQPVARIAEGFVPYALVTPDGEWHERARMGWWAVPITDEKPADEWEQEVARLYLAHKDATAVLVDCHV